MDWKQEMLKRLDMLADKLGTTTAYLWSILLKQAWLDGIELLIAVGFLTVLAVAAYKYGNECFVYAKETDDDYYSGGYFLRIVMFLCLGSACWCLGDAVEHFLNPGYFALHEVLETLGK
jgi:hypothetical protein